MDLYQPVIMAIDLTQTWPWWIGGPLIALIMFLLLYFGRSFGISDNFRIICAASGGDHLAEFFKFDWKARNWNLWVAVGAMLGGALATLFLTGPQGPTAGISAATVESLQGLGMHYDIGKVPLVPDFYSWSALTTLQGLLVMVLGGFLVGFGARYAGGCTSGHAISGLSALQLPSLVAVIGFFSGGLFMTYIIFPLIFN